MITESQTVSLTERQLSDTHLSEIREVADTEQTRLESVIRGAVETEVVHQDGMYQIHIRVVMPTGADDRMTKTLMQASAKNVVDGLLIEE